MVLQGEKIFLRNITVNDVSDEYLSWLNDDEVTKGLETSGYTKESLSEYVEEMINNPDVCMFAIIDKESGRHIGNIKLNLNRKHHHADLGILIGDKTFWGRGIGADAIKLAIDFAFKQFNLFKVWLCVFSNNSAAINLYRKIGFVEEGCMKNQVYIKGEFFDKYYMSVFADNRNQ